MRFLFFVYYYIIFVNLLRFLSVQLSLFGGAYKPASLWEDFFSFLIVTVGTVNLGESKITAFYAIFVKWQFTRPFLDKYEIYALKMKLLHQWF